MFEINGTQWCPYCQEAKNLLESLNEDFQFVDLDEIPEKAMQMVQKGMKTIPQIYYNEKHIGGFQELQQFLEENK